MSMQSIPDKTDEQNILDALFFLVQSPSFPKSIVDVGANHNATISIPFIEKNWDVLLIEPQQSCIHLLIKKFNAYPNVHILHCGCSDVEAVLPLYKGKDSETSELATFNEQNDPWMNMVRDNEHYEKVIVRRLSQILDLNPVFKDIGILKIDTESFDYKVILGIDFDRHHPKIIITEEYLWDFDQTIKKHKLLEEVGYICIGWSGYNTIWLCRQFFKLSWCEIALWAWLKEINKAPLPFDLLSYFHDIQKIVDSTRYWDGCIFEIDCLIVCRDIITNPNRHISIPVTISNYGTTPIPSMPQLYTGRRIFLSYHIKCQNEYILWDGIRTPLLKDIKPKESIVLEMNFIAPDNPCNYIVEIDLVAEGEAWFSSRVNSSGPYFVTLIVNNTDDVF